MRLRRTISGIIEPARILEKIELTTAKNLVDRVWAYPELGGCMLLKRLAPNLWSTGVLECWNEVHQKLLKLK